MVELFKICAVSYWEMRRLAAYLCEFEIIVSKHHQPGDGSISGQNEDKGVAINLHDITWNEPLYVGSRFNTYVCQTLGRYVWDISCNVCPEKLSVLSVLQMYLGAYFIIAWWHFRRRHDSEFQITYACIHTYREKLSFCCKTRAWPVTGISIISLAIRLFWYRPVNRKKDFRYTSGIDWHLIVRRRQSAAIYIRYWSDCIDPNQIRGEMVCLQLIKENL